MRNKIREGFEYLIQDGDDDEYVPPEDRKAYKVWLMSDLNEQETIYSGNVGWFSSEQVAAVRTWK